jgi:hypothetical protein
MFVHILHLIQNLSPHLHIRGIDYVKLDWCTKYEDKDELTTKFREALDRSGRDMWLNFHCDGAYQDWCAADGNSWRIGPDHHDIWDGNSGTGNVINILATVNEKNQTGPVGVSLY